jgi:hypothetical protein
MTPYPQQYKSVHYLTIAVKTLLITGAVISGLSLIVLILGTMSTPFTEEEVGDNPIGFAIALLEFGLGLLSVFLYLATVVCYLIWIYRSYSNLPAFGNPRHHLGYSAGWAVGFWFIPFANLVLPYRIVKEVWEKSTPFQRTLLGADQPPHWFPAWWAFWLLSNFIGNIYGRVALQGRADPTYVVVLGIASESTSILASIFALIIVSDIGKRQEDASKSLQLGQYAVPPSPPGPASSPMGMQPPGPYLG